MAAPIWSKAAACEGLSVWGARTGPAALIATGSARSVTSFLRARARAAGLASRTMDSRSFKLCEPGCSSRKASSSRSGLPSLAAGCPPGPAPAGSAGASTARLQWGEGQYLAFGLAELGGGVPPGPGAGWLDGCLDAQAVGGRAQRIALGLDLLDHDEALALQSAQGVGGQRQLTLQISGG